MADADDRQAGVLLLKDLELFNRAIMYFERKIGPAAAVAVGEAVRQWTDGHGWKCEGFDNPETSTFWVSPPQWYISDDDYLAWFEIDYQDKNSDTSYWLANLTGVGETDVGFRFVVDHGNFGGRSSWNRFAKTLGDNVGPRLKERGWMHEERGVYFRKLRLPADRLADAWENEDWAPVLEPLERALDALAEAVPIFDSLIAGAKAAQP